jgi:hypothetical protein
LTLLFSSQLALAQFSQRGSKLVGTGAVGDANEGWAVTRSADGNTAIVGGCCDNTNIGAVWVFIRTNGVWSWQSPNKGPSRSPVAIGTLGSRGFRLVSVAKLVDFECGQYSYADFIGITVLPCG